MEKKCVKCGASFLALHPHRKYCLDCKFPKKKVAATNAPDYIGACLCRAGAPNGNCPHLGGEFNQGYTPAATAVELAPTPWERGEF